MLFGRIMIISSCEPAHCRQPTRLAADYYFLIIFVFIVVVVVVWVFAGAAASDSGNRYQNE